MSGSQQPPDQEERLGSPYLSPPSDRRNIFNNSNNNSGNQSASTSGQQKNNEKNTKEQKKDIIKKDQKKIEKEKIQKNIETPGRERSSSVTSIATTTSEVRSSKKRSAEDSLLASATNINIVNQEHLNTKQQQCLQEFIAHNKKIPCINCNAKYLHVLRIDCIEVNETEEIADIIFQCKNCKKINQQSYIEEQIFKLVTSKKRKNIDITDNLSKIDIEKKAKEYADLNDSFITHRNNIQCPQCKTNGSVNKNGNNNHGNPPPPQYRCKQCNKNITIHEMKILLKYLFVDEENNEEERMEEDNDEFVDTENQLTDMDDDDEHNEDEYNNEVYDEQQQDITMDFKSEIITLKKQFEKKEKETEKMKKMLKENTLLILDLKKMIQKLLKEKNNDIDEQKKNIIEKEKNKKKENTHNIETNPRYLQEPSSHFIEPITHINNPTHIEPASYLNPQPLQQQQQSNNNMDLSYTQQFPALSSFNQNDQQPTMWTKKQRNQFFRRNNPTKKQQEQCQRTFSEKITDNNFINVYVYLKSHRRMKPSEIRKELSFAGIDNVQILDTYSPDWDTVLLLIHEGYKEELQKKLEKVNIHFKEYNYLHTSHLRDPRCANFTNEEKVERLKSYRNKCAMRALNYIREPVNKSVARCFFRQQIITEEQLKEFLKSKSNRLGGLQHDEERGSNQQEVEQVDRVVEDDAEKSKDVDMRESEGNKNNEQDTYENTEIPLDVADNNATVTDTTQATTNDN